MHADGRPSGSDDVMHIDTEQLHLDMTQKLATTAAKVTGGSGAGNVLRGRGMRADMINDRLQLAGDVHGVLAAH